MRVQSLGQASGAPSCSPCVERCARRGVRGLVGRGMREERQQKRREDADNKSRTSAPVDRRRGFEEQCAGREAGGEAGGRGRRIKDSDGGGGERRASKKQRDARGTPHVRSGGGRRGECCAHGLAVGEAGGHGGSGKDSRASGAARGRPGERPRDGQPAARRQRGRKAVVDACMGTKERNHNSRFVRQLVFRTCTEPFI